MQLIDAADIGTAEIVLENAEAIHNQTDGTITLEDGSGTDYATFTSALLTAVGDLKVAGDDIQDSGGNTTLSFDGSGNIDSIATLITTLTMDTTHEINFRDSALKIYLYSSADGQLDIDADTTLQINAPTVDIDLGTEMQIDGALVDIGTGTYTLANGDNDLGVAGDIETVGNIVLSDGSSNYTGFTAQAMSGNQIYTLPAADGNTSDILSTSGGGVLSWVNAAGAAASAIYWNQSNGALYPKNSTVDLLIGGQATDSAKFAFINVDSGTPTASISGDIVLNSAGVIQTTENQLLTIGGDTTGNIYLNGNVGIGTATPGYKLDVYGGDFQVTNTGETARVRLNTTGGAVSREWMFFASSVDGGFGIYDVTGSQRRMTILTSGNVGIGDSSPTSLFTVGSGDLFQIDSSGRIVAIDNVAHTIDDVSGDLTLTSNSGEVDIADDLAVNGATSADITSTTATATLFNSTPTTVSIGGVATTLNYGAGGALGRAINIGTGTGIDTISIGTGATGADVINIGSSNAGNLTVASGTTFDLDAATVNIDGSTAINIGTTADKPIDVDADTFDLDASGALTLTGAANSTIDFPNFDVATTGVL